MVINKYDWLSFSEKKHLTLAAANNEDYETARQEALRYLETGLELGGKPLTREEIYVR
jgi:hypothetical protein